MAVTPVPEWLVGLLPEDTARVWPIVAASTPPDFYLAGGTAIAVHLRHRRSRDLDLFTHTAFAPDEIATELDSIGTFVVTEMDEMTLNGVFEATRVQFLSVPGETRLGGGEACAGFVVADLRDLFAMKLNAVGGRAELRDYYDLLRLDQDSPYTSEQALGMYLARYEPPTPDANIRHVVEALGYLDDVTDDPGLPASRVEIAAYWRRRQPEIVAHLDRWGLPDRP